MKLKLLPILLFILLFTSLVTPVSAAEFYNSEELVTEMTISSKINIEPESSSYTLKYVTANLSFFPKELENQEILRQEFVPEPASSKPNIIFRWENPKQNSLPYSIKTKILTKDRTAMIHDKVKFPLAKIPEDILPFLEESPHIDITPEIIELATDLAQGEDDLFEIEMKFADWINKNIEYSLSTLTADVSQKSSWVLAKRQGVCDEITNLFLAMNRAIGVPGKFVAGIAYTESPEFPEKWGGHGWGEVYFPGYGWVPFDITYDELGFLDPTHIILAETLDSEDSSTSYEWLGSKVSISTDKLDIDTDVVSSSGSVQENIEIKAYPFHEQIGFGSYNLIEAEVTNKNNYYLPIRLAVSKPKELKLLDKNTASLLLRPKQTKKVSWLVQLTEDLNDNYIYTFPIEVSTFRNQSSSTSFTSTSTNTVYDYDQLKMIQEGTIEEQEKELSANVEFKCTIPQAEYDQNQVAKISCNAKNTGNINMERIEACIENQCTFIDLKINQAKEFSSKVTLSRIGTQKFAATLDSSEISKTAFIETFVWDKPSIKIKDIIYPASVNFDNEYKIEFKLIRDSLAPAVNSSVILSGNNIENTWALEDIDAEKNIELNLHANLLEKGANNFSIKVIYYDRYGTEYTDEEYYTIELEKLSFFQSIKYFFTRISLFFE